MNEGWIRKQNYDEYEGSHSFVKKKVNNLMNKFLLKTLTIDNSVTFFNK